MALVSVCDPALPFRRRIRLVTTEPGVVVADIEDDFHRFRVTLGHDATNITSVDAEALRVPWSTCPGAVVPLRALVGAPLTLSIAALSEHADPNANCTHMFDLAALAIAHAARGGVRRQYDAEVPVHRDEAAQCRLWRDGELVLTFEAQGRKLLSPAPYTDGPWKRGFMRWAETTLEPDDAEAAIVLRRAINIGSGRGMPLDFLETAEPLISVMDGVCFTMTRGVAETATRQKVSMRDYGNDPDGLLTND